MKEYPFDLKYAQKHPDRIYVLGASGGMDLVGKQVKVLSFDGGTKAHPIVVNVGGDCVFCVNNEGRGLRSVLGVMKNIRKIKVYITTYCIDSDPKVHITHDEVLHRNLARNLATNVSITNLRASTDEVEVEEC